MARGLEYGTLYRRGKIWWIKWTSRLTSRVYRRSTRCRDERAALKEARRIQRRTELEEAGVPVTDHEADLVELVGVWQAHLRGKERTERHVSESGKVVLWFLGDEGISHPASLSWQRAERWLRREAGKRDWSARTYNCYMGYLRAFGRWLHEREQVVSENPFLGLEGRRKNPRLKRRALDDDPTDPRIVAGQGRALVEVSPWPWPVIYLTALGTGLRRSELERLEWRDLGLKKGAMVVRWEASKARREDILPLSRELVRALEQLRALRSMGVEEHPRDVELVRQLGKEHQGDVKKVVAELQRQGAKRARGANWGKVHVRAILTPTRREIPPTEQVFGSALRSRLETTLYRHLDLVSPAIPRKTAEGKVDLHALRKTFATQLRRRNVNEIVIQRLMRHTDPRLTRVVYQSFDLLDLRPAVERA